MLATSACREPTQITVELSTDVACAEARATTVTVGLPGGLERGDPAVVSSACESEGSRGELGTVVLVPSGDDDAPVGVKVTLAVSDDAVEDCSKEYGRHCIVARRTLRYLPHTPLVLPIELSRVCQGVFCDEDSTCQNGVCVDATVDPNDCAAPPGCVPGGPGGSGGAGGAGGAGGGGGDGGDDCVVPVTEDAVTLPTEESMTTSLRALAVAADPAGCGWAAAWGNGSRLCVLDVDAVIHGGGASVACSETAPAAFHRVEMASIAGRYFVAGSIPGGSQVRLMEAARDDGWTVTTRATLSSWVSASLTASPDDRLLLVSETLTSGSPLRAQTYAWSSANQSLSGSVTKTITPLAGLAPDVAWDGTTITLGWFEEAQRALCARFDEGETPSPSGLAASVLSNVAVARRGAAGAAFFVNVNGRALLYAIQSTGAEQLFEVDLLPLLPGFGSPKVELVGTAGAWVALVHADDKVLLLRRGDDASVATVYQLPGVAAREVAIAARGNQLGLVWQDMEEVLHFRLVAADLADL